MIILDINNGDKKMFSMNIESIELFNRNKCEVSKMLESYIFQIETTQLYEEMKQKIQLILDSDIKHNRKMKLEKIHQKYNIKQNDWNF